jgi:stage V sporulation protein D (sporulation-specific penicillin-binding protein)
MAIKNSAGATVEKIKPVVVTKTVSADTSAFIKEAMYLTVKEGTATKAQMKGYLLGGKTGTAQKYPREAGKNLVSFLGFIEAEGRKIVYYVVVDEAHDEEMMSKSSTASTLAAGILEEALPYLKIYPEGEIKYYIETVEEEDILTNETDNPDYLPENDESTADVIEETVAGAAETEEPEAEVTE